jgi:hypothetical protein
LFGGNRHGAPLQSRCSHRITFYGDTPHSKAQLT